MMTNDEYSESIVCIGCSYTSGLDEHGKDSYPYVLSNIQSRPVINLGLGGSCFTTAAYMLEQALHNRQPKFIFFQITGPFRESSLKQEYLDFDNDIFKVTDNYNHLVFPDDIFYPMPMGNTALSKYKWLQNYYTVKEPGIDILWKTRNYSLLMYVKKLLNNVPHFIYAQHWQWHYQNDISFFLDRDLFYNYESRTIDDGGHLNRESINDQAEYFKSIIDKFCK